MLFVKSDFFNSLFWIFEFCEVFFFFKFLECICCFLCRLEKKIGKYLGKLNELNIFICFKK